jgi:hypothetical protein
MNKTITFIFFILLIIIGISIHLTKVKDRISAENSSKLQTNSQLSY